jgi:DNA-binding SARP family transcriptional activator
VPVTQVRVTLIDGFELRCDGEPASLPLASQRLVAYLALRDRPLLRIQVAGTLWLHSSENRSYANLRTALWRLGRARGAVVETTTSHVGLSDAVVVDVRRMSALARGVLEDPAAAERLEDSDLEGELLPGWYDDWVLMERERLRQLRVHALERLAEHATRLGRHGQAVDRALTAIQADPLRESAHRVLIRAYVAEGNIGLAIRQYRECCRMLREELELGPSREMRELVAEIIA